jgi:site-specific DNA-methyltransferase (adenine-specific)
MKNTLYFGDNLQIMRDYIEDNSIDLIYLDPPFNSKATYNVLFDEKNGTHSRAQITAFEDTWHWGIESEEAYREIVKQGPKKLADLIQALRSFLGRNDMMAYLVMIAIRLVEMHRVLKSTGSIYLHCDPTASHYIKIVMDSIFGFKCYQNEIIWHYRRWSNIQKRFQKMHDIILFYSKEPDNHIFNPLLVEFSDSQKKKFDRGYDSNVIHTKNSKYSQLIVYNWDRVRQSGLDLSKYKNIVEKDIPSTSSPDVLILPPINSQAKERLGYPTQKPEKLLEILINISTNKGDIVLDPFCGCGTTVAVAENLKRKWIGIDITHLAITLMRHRLKTTFGKDLSPYEVIGDPKDLQGAKALAEHDRFQFEWWALGKVSARPAQDKKKGADRGVDGYIYFFDDNSGKAKKIIIQVKSGHVCRNHIATLKGDMESENAEIGAFITLEEPSGPMKEEAVSAGFYEPEFLQGKKYPKVQILTIKELFQDMQLKYPRIIPEATFKNAKRKVDKGEQRKLL